MSRSVQDESVPEPNEHPLPGQPVQDQPGEPDSALASQPPARLRPVDESERVDAVDTVRGLAVLGILAMNIYAFAMPMIAYDNPSFYGGTDALSYGTWAFTHLLFDQKFMPLFSMLFGAGLVLMDQRAEARGTRFRSIYYRRSLWLVAIGLVHMFLIWEGDVLFTYGLCGLVLYLFRRRKPRFLLVLGMILMLIPPLLSTGFGLWMHRNQTLAAQAEARLAAGATLTAEETQAREAWTKRQERIAKIPERIREQLESYRSDYATVVAARAPEVVKFQLSSLIGYIWRTLGLMLIGMALMKLGVLGAQRSARFYWRCLVVGYGLGLPLAAVSAYQVLTRGFDPVYRTLIGGHFNYVGSLLVALGHLAVLMLLCQHGALTGARTRLAAVGRMALSNYLMCSLVCTLVFYGYGLGLYGTLDRFAQMGVVLAIWTVQLVVSPLWLRAFRYGPAEWLWRSLTYWRRQPMRRPVLAAAEPLTAPSA